MQSSSSPETAQPLLFLSYCRRETPFVNDLFRLLERAGYDVWLDYQCLIPGRPWQVQIDLGIVEADVFLLVVSREAIASPNVEYEWHRALALEKRIVLLIFEAVPLPMELQYCEWIDFRGMFERSVKQLQVQLALPATQKHNPPQEGFKVSPWVWFTVTITAIVSVFSIFSWWTLYVPFYLVPLPYQILKRNFNFYRVQNALLILPITNLFQFVFFPDEWSLVVGVLMTVSFTSGGLLLLLLRTPALRRWVKPIASRPQFANPYVPKIRNPRPVRYWIDAAPEDENYAKDIHRRLQQYGHLPVAETDAPEVVIVLISEFKRGTTFCFRKATVYPVILQSTNSVDPDLQRVQWIDFRSGLRNLDRFAQLLPEPARLLKALGVAPISDQIVLPKIVQILVYTLSFLAVVAMGGWLTFVMQHLHALSLKEVGLTVLFQITPTVLTIRMIQALIRRNHPIATAGWLAQILFLLFLFAGAQIVVLIVSVGDIMESSTRSQSLSLIRLFIFHLINLLTICGLALLALWYRRDLQRWFPVRPSTGS